MNPDSGDTVAAMARLAASVETEGDEGRKAAERGGQEMGAPAEVVAEDAEAAAGGENGEAGEALEAELTRVGE